MERKNLFPFQRPTSVSTRAAQGQVQSSQIDTEAGVLRDVVLCQAMQPKGWAGYTWIPEDTHDMWWSDYERVRVETDQTFINTLVDIGSKKENGLKVRLGHPGWMDTGRESVITYCGRVQNIRVRDNQAIGDIELSDASSTAPGFGDIRGHVLRMAGEAPDAMMMSIVFTPGNYFFINAKGEREEFKCNQDQVDYILGLPEADRVLYESLTDVNAIDFVNEGANTNDLFRSASGQMQVMQGFMETLQRNPEMWDSLESEPQNVQLFLRLYASRMKKKGLDFQINMNKNQRNNAGVLETLKSGFKNIMRMLDGEETHAADATAKAIENTAADGTVLSIETDAETPAVGDQVYVSGTTDAPAAGTHTLGGDLDGWIITTDDAGLITEVTEPEAAAADESQANATDPEENTRQITELTGVVRSLVETIAPLAKSVGELQADMRTLHTAPLTQRAFAKAGNKVTDNRSADTEPESEWAARQREINEKKRAKASE